MSSVVEPSGTTGLIDGAAIAEADSWVGRPLRYERWNTTASPDNVRHYALGLGDLNPLWQDMEHGLRSRYGDNIAPPTFPYSVYDAEVMPGLGQLMALHTGSTWTFHDVVRIGDEIDAEPILESSRVIEGSDGARRIEQVGLTKYFRVKPDGSRTPISEVRQRILRMPRKGVGDDGLNMQPRKVYRYSPAELDRIQGDVLAATIRGTEPRLFDEVSVGDSVGQVVKGPYDRMTMICYYAGAIASPGYRAHEAWWHNRWLALTDPDKLPTDAFDPEYFTGLGVTSMGHHNEEAADRMGMPGMYDNGNQRVGTTATLVTNWMGDDATLHELSVHIRRPVIEGDTVWISGEVSDKREHVEYGPVVELTINGVNQLGESVTRGSALVGLPG